MSPTIRTLIAAARPWSFSASLGPFAVGAQLAYKWNGRFSVGAAALAAVCVVAVHAGANLVNTHCDYVNGVDGPTSADRTLVDGRLDVRQVWLSAVVAYVASFVVFVALLLLPSSSIAGDPHRVVADEILLVVLYVGGVLAGVGYTAGPRFKYVAAGDAVVYVAFGPTTVLFAYVTQTSAADAWTAAGPLLAHAAPLAFTVEAILHANNVRDADADRRAGVRTLVDVIGPTGSRWLFAALLALPFACSAATAIVWRSPSYLVPLVGAPTAVGCVRRYSNGRLVGLPDAVAALNLQLAVAYVCAIAFDD